MIIEDKSSTVCEKKVVLSTDSSTTESVCTDTAESVCTDTSESRLANKFGGRNVSPFGPVKTMPNFVESVSLTCQEERAVQNC